MAILKCRWIALVVLAVSAPACLEGLTDRGYSGEPLLKMKGQVVTFERINYGGHDLRLSLFWIVQDAGDQTLLKEQSSTSVSVQFPDSFEVNVFHPPSPDLLLSEDDLPYGAAWLLVYEDLNDDKRYASAGSQDKLVGGAMSRLVAYFPRAVSVEESPTGLAHPAGYSVVPIPLDCDSKVNLSPTQPGERDCGVPLGSPCSEGSCGDGAQCITRSWNIEFPGGYCVMDYDPDGCLPINGSLVPMVQPAWIKSCTVDTDCTREAYSCTNLPSEDGSACQACWPESIPANYSGACQPSTQQDSDFSRRCGDRLGRACTRHEDCAAEGNSAGLCLHRLADREVPGGYCTLADAEHSCVPPNGHFTWLADTSWMQKCTADSDCREHYVCYPMYKACGPDLPILLEIPEDFDPAEDLTPICL